VSGRRDFDDVFIDELQQQESLLDLERYCPHGGFPDLETTSFQVSRVEGDGDDAVVHVKCEFDESVATSCGAISFLYPTFGEFTVAYPQATNAATWSTCPSTTTRCFSQLTGRRPPL
jgi:hypothetical protein